MKKCTTCGTEKPEEAFEMQPSRGRRRAECRDCRKVSQKAWREQRKANPPQKKPETKQCTCCQQVKDISEFSPASPGYFHGKCKTCEQVIRQKKRREQYQNDPTGKYYRPFINEEGIKIKRCSLCHAEKPIDEFYTSVAKKGYYDSRCKKCALTEQKLIYDNNPEKYRAYSREYARKHPDEHRARYQRWEAANQERRRQYFRERSESRREQGRAYARIRHSKETAEDRHEQYLQRRDYYRIYREKFGDRLNANKARWRQTFPEKHAENQNRRRARKRNAPRIEKIDRIALIERDNWTCYLCGCICTSEDVTLDHVVPLSKGGSHTSDNLRVACFTCNLRKGSKLLDDFLAG